MTFAERAKELVAQMTLPEKCAQMKYDAPAIERLSVPAYNWWNEALHGVARSGAATVFPQAIGMAASFNTPLMFRTAVAISDEIRAKHNEYKQFGDTQQYQGLTIWSPNINIFRDPRWGRGHETYGEDPYLTGEMGTAFIKGLQGDDPVYRKSDATIKHYAVHSGPENGRHHFDAVVGDEDLYETYLFAFKYCIDHADPSAVMGAYNRINGEPACGSKTYLKDILMGELGFEGYVLSDCGAICDFNLHHHVTENAAESSAMAVNNGCILNCGDAYKWLVTAVVEEMISEETITAAVEKLFEARFRLGMFDETPYDSIPYDVVECDAHRALSLQMAHESVVLLKNDGILPLRKDMNIAVVGPGGDDLSVLLGNYNGTPSRYTTILKGIQDQTKGNVYSARGCHVYKAMKDIDRWDEHPLRDALIAIKKSDAVVLCMGLNPQLEGEQADEFNGMMSGDKQSIDLPESQMEFLEEVLKMGKPTVFLNIAGSCINLRRMEQACNAVLQVYYPGAEGGTAVADLLYGKVSPSGRLPLTYYRSDGDLPPFEDYSIENRTYKYFRGEPLYPFGFGLSYTDFTYEDVRFTGGKVSLRVANTGGMDGAETVTVFLKDPGETKVNCRLAGFAKIFVKSGEKVSLDIELSPEILERFPDRNGLVALVGGVNGTPVKQEGTV